LVEKPKPGETGVNPMMSLSVVLLCLGVVVVAVIIAALVIVAILERKPTDRS